MPTPFSFTFGRWVPDGANVGDTIQSLYQSQDLHLVDCLNVYWNNETYISTPSSAALAGTPTLPTTPVFGAFTALDTSGVAQVYAGGGSDLYHWGGSSWTNVSKSAGAYTSTAHWSFVQFGGCVIAQNGVAAQQDMTIGGTNFADVTAAPIGSVLGVIGQFLMVGDLTTGPFPYRVQWSGVGDPTNWPTPLTNAAIAAQSGQQDLTQEFGRVLGIAGFPQYGVILQQQGLTRVTYVGGDVVFRFDPYEFKRGVVARNAWVKHGSLVYFIAEDGFWVTDGSSTQAIGRSEDGEQGVDGWLRSNMNWNALSAVSAAWDAKKHNVCFSIPTGSNTTADTLLTYNPTSHRWTRTSQTAKLIWTDTDGVTHQVSLFDTNSKYAQLTGAPASGYLETYDAQFLDGKRRFCTGLRINGITSDSPTARVGVKNALDDAVTYTTDNSRDAFTKVIGFIPQEGFFNRWRVTSAGFTGVYGATVMIEDGGET